MELIMATASLYHAFDIEVHTPAAAFHLLDTFNGAPVGKSVKVSISERQQ
jgi:hypothetical protein